MLVLNSYNKGIKNTIYSDKYKDFFFFHNGITAICNKMTVQGNKLNLSGLSVVNGCQSLNTILSCSEKVKTLDDTYILCRFYEIPQRDRGDKISTSTNSQSAVKPRDLRSNDKRVLNLKKVFEQKYPQGYFITKRGEVPPADRDKRYVLDLSDLGKYLISWYSQRPNIAYSETKIFDKYFEQLFKREYKPENAQALDFDLTGFNGFIEWIAVKRPNLSGEKGTFLIKITPPYPSNEGKVSASAQSIESWSFETVISNVEPVTIEELYDVLHASFVLFCPVI